MGKLMRFTSSFRIPEKVSQEEAFSHQLTPALCKGDQTSFALRTHQNIGSGSPSCCRHDQRTSADRLCFLNWSPPVVQSNFHLETVTVDFDLKAL